MLSYFRKFGVTNTFTRKNPHRIIQIRLSSSNNSIRIILDTATLSLSFAVVSIYSCLFIEQSIDEPQYRGQIECQKLCFSPDPLHGQVYGCLRKLFTRELSDNCTLIQDQNPVANQNEIFQPRGCQNDSRGFGEFFPYYS